MRATTKTRKPTKRQLARLEKFRREAACDYLLSWLDRHYKRMREMHPEKYEERPEAA